VSVKVSAAVAVGFWLFALGHLSLIHQALRASRALASDIRRGLETATDDNAEFMASLNAIARTSYRPWASYVIHVTIDLCVTVAIWSKHLS